MASESLRESGLLKKLPYFDLFQRVAWFLVAVGILVGFATNLAWSAMFLVLAIVFRDQVRALLLGISDMLTRGTGLDLEIAGQKLKLTANEVSNLLQDIANDISLMIDQLTSEQRDLFIFVTQTSQTREVPIGDMPMGFKRLEPPTQLHQDLRALRERHLLRPRGGGTWREHKYLEITPFGDLVARTPSLGLLSHHDVKIQEYLSQARITRLD